LSIKIDIETQVNRNNLKVSELKLSVDAMKNLPTRYRDESYYIELDKLEAEIVRRNNNISNMNLILSNLLVDNGQFGTTEEMIETCIVSEIIMKSASSFGEEGLMKLNEQMNKLLLLKQTTIDDAWGESSDAIQGFLEKTSFVQDSFSTISNGLEEYSNKLLELSQLSSALAWVNKNPVMGEIIDVIMKCSSIDNSLYESVKGLSVTEVNDVISLKMNDIKIG